jgi:hypothetical protein
MTEPIGHGGQNSRLLRFAKTLECVHNHKSINDYKYLAHFL